MDYAPVHGCEAATAVSGAATTKVPTLPLRQLKHGYRELTGSHRNVVESKV